MAKMERVEPFFLVSVFRAGFTAAEQHAEHASHIDTNRDVNREVLVCPDSRENFPNVEAALPMRACCSETRDPDAVTFDPR